MTELTRIEREGNRLRFWSQRGYEGDIAITKANALSTRFTYSRMLAENQGWLPTLEAAASTHEVPNG